MAFQQLRGHKQNHRKAKENLLNENYSEDTNKTIENSLLKEQLQTVTTQKLLYPRPSVQPQQTLHLLSYSSIPLESFYSDFPHKFLIRINQNL